MTLKSGQFGVASQKGVRWSACPHLWGRRAIALGLSAPWTNHVLCHRLLYDDTVSIIWSYSFSRYTHVAQTLATKHPFHTRLTSPASMSRGRRI